MKPESFASHVPLVLFTGALLISVGLAGAMALGASGLHPWALGLLAFGGLASFLHLGRKTRAPGSLRGMGHSWLSREAALAGVYGALLLASFWEPRLLPHPASLGGILVLALVRLYALEAQPLWRAWPHQLAPLAATALVAVLPTGRPLLVVPLALLDLVLLGLRLRLHHQPWPGLAVAFPSHGRGVDLALGLRFLITLAGLTLRGPWGLALLGLALFLDRYAFYAGARHQDPGARVAAHKAARMSEALGKDRGEAGSME